MSGYRAYGGIIWTNHALERIGQRGLTQEMALAAFKSPDSSEKGKEGATEFKKTFGASTVTVIGKLNDKKEWIVISCWIHPPLPGTEDFKKHQKYKEYKKATGLRKFFLTILRQLFG